METKELKIQIPEGYCIDESKSTFEKIVFKKKDTGSRSWEEYCKLKKENLEHGYMIDGTDTRIEKVEWKHLGAHMSHCWRNVLPSKELAEAFLAMMQLMSLRQAWIGDWKFDWTNDIRKWSIVSEEYKLNVEYFYSTSRPLSFPTKEMAKDFINCFKDLLEIAKPLI